MPAHGNTVVRFQAGYCACTCAPYSTAFDALGKCMAVNSKALLFFYK